LRRPDRIALVGAYLGQLLHGEEARQVLDVSLAAASKIGWTDVAREITELVESLDTGDEET
jgi:hypothetical protein